MPHRNAAPATILFIHVLWFRREGMWMDKASTVFSALTVLQLWSVFVMLACRDRSSAVLFVFTTVFAA